MSMDLEKKSFSTAPRYFIAGAYPIAKAVKTAAEAIAEHTAVALDENGKITALTSANKANIYGITPDSIEKDKDGPVYLTGEFFTSAIALPNGMTGTELSHALRNIGIYLK